jgi:hypothetical protein
VILLLGAGWYVAGMIDDNTEGSAADVVAWLMFVALLAAFVVLLVIAAKRYFGSPS